MKTVVLIEDHSLMRRGLASFLAGTGKWRIIGEAASLKEATVLFESISAGATPMPDLTLLDIQLEKEWGLDLLPLLKERYGEAAPPVLVYSVYEDYSHVKAAIRAGAAGYVYKSREDVELEMAMDAVLRGGFFSAPHLMSRIAEVSDIMLGLTKREHQVFGMVQRGMINRDIAVELGISVRTVENVLSIIYDKTGIGSRKELEKL
jgi:DNA-binding NarL/FixJ family response regulator